MEKERIKGKAQTVLGLVDGNELGFTLPHEHIFIDIRCYWIEPTDPEEKKLARQKITLENLHWARYHRRSCEDCLFFNDEEMAIRETMRFKKAGGGTIVDMSCNNIGRNPKGLVNVSKATGLNIIMGTSYYVGESYTPEMKMDSRTAEDIAQEFIRDITVGVGDTGIKAGVIGEIGTSWPVKEGEGKVLRAAVMAQQETGAVVNVHPGGSQDAASWCLKVLEEAGADLSRVVFSHMTRTFPIDARSARARLADKGCYLEYDIFGHDGSYPPFMADHDVGNDAIRISQIRELIADGYLDKILISQDICYKINLSSYGGGGYALIPTVVIPVMLNRGMTEEQIHTITVENPKRALTFV